MFFIIKAVEETILDFSQGTVKVLQRGFANLRGINIFYINITVSQCHSVNLKLSNSLLNITKSATKFTTDVILRLSSIMIGTNKTFFFLLMENYQKCLLKT